MKISSAITKTERAQVVKDAVEKLCSLTMHPRLGELLKELVLSSNEKEERRGSWRSRWTGETGILKITSGGLEEVVVKRDGYRYTTGGLDLVICQPYKVGGSTEASARIVREPDFPTIAEKYDLDPNDMQKVIDRISS